MCIRDRSSSSSTKVGLSVTLQRCIDISARWALFSCSGGDRNAYDARVCSGCCLLPHVPRDQQPTRYGFLSRQLPEIPVAGFCVHCN